MSQIPVVLALYLSIFEAFASFFHPTVLWALCTHLQKSDICPSPSFSLICIPYLCYSFMPHAADLMPCLHTSFSFSPTQFPFLSATFNCTILLSSACFLFLSLSVPAIERVYLHFLLPLLQQMQFNHFWFFLFCFVLYLCLSLPLVQPCLIRWHCYGTPHK